MWSSVDGQLRESAMQCLEGVSTNRAAYLQRMGVVGGRERDRPAAYKRSDMTVVSRQRTRGARGGASV